MDIKWDWGRIRTALFVIIAVQAAFWFVINPVLFAPAARPDAIPVENAAMAKAQGTSEADFAAAQFAPVKLPTSDCCGPGYRLVRMDFSLDAVPADGLALIPSVGADNTWIRINGRLAHQPGRIALSDPTYHGNVKTVIHIAPGLLQAGTNRMEYALVRTGVPYFDLGKPMLAPWSKTSQNLAWRQFVLNEYKVMTYSFGLLAAIIALLLLLRSDNRRFAFWVLVLLSTWSLRSHYYTWTDPFLPDAWRLPYYFALTTLIPLAWVNFVNTWTGNRWRWLEWASIAAGLAVLLSHLTLPGGGAEAYDRAVLLTNGLGMVLGAIGGLRFVWHVLTRADDRHWEAALFLLCITLMTTDFVRTLWLGKSSAFLETTFPIMILSFPVAFIARNIRLFRSMNEINALLQEKLAAREAELAEQYARQEELARRETLVAERQRLMRDMHDGIGGQLMGLLFAARRKPIAQADLTESLQQVIDELRLVIDSMDSVGETLGTALATFHARIEPRLEAAGIALEWNNPAGEDLGRTEPRDVIQVFRILQEAVTNAIKHSGSDRIVVTIERDDAEVVIAVRDFGKGLSEGRPGGHGLSNMANRAQTIGGAVDIITRQPGTEVRLTIPDHPVG